MQYFHGWWGHHEGTHFRISDIIHLLVDSQMLETVPRFQVLDSCSFIKKISVEKLSVLGEIVGVTGDGINEGPALKTAHVRFSTSSSELSVLE